MPALLRRLPYIGAIVLVVLLAGGVLWSQMESRRALETRFTTRAELAAHFTDRFAADLMARERSAAQALMSGEVDPGRFGEQVLALGFHAAVLLDSQGRFIVGYPHREDLVGQDLTPQYPHLRHAVREGTPAVSPVVPSAAEGIPLVGFAVPFETPSGRRVFSGGFFLSSGLLGAFLRDSVPFSDASVVLIDQPGAVIAASRPDPAPTKLESLDPGLARAVSTSDSGSYTKDGESIYFTAVDIERIGWRLAAAVPAKSLYRPVSGLATWVPWVILILLAISAAIVASAIKRASEARIALAGSNEELRKANSLINEFVAVASHDLRGPLTSILGYTFMLRRDRETIATERRDEFMAAIERSAKHIRRMTEDLLTVTAVDSEILKPIPELLDLSELASDLIREYQPDMEINSQIPTATWTFADPSHVRRILDNYVSNAKKYGRPPVTLEAKEVGEYIEVRVKERGPGVPADARDDLFGKFGKASRRTRSTKESTGLGLSIVKSLAEANGGEAWYESTNEHPSCFAVKLPAHMMPEA